METCPWCRHSTPMPTMSEGESGLRCVGCMRPYIQPGESPSEQVTTGEAAEQVTAGEVAEQVTAVEGECECIHEMQAVVATGWCRVVTQTVVVTRLRLYWGQLGPFLNAITLRGKQEAAAAAERLAAAKAAAAASAAEVEAMATVMTFASGAQLLVGGLEAAHTAARGGENNCRFTHIVECRAKAHAQPKAILSQVIVTRRRRAKQNHTLGLRPSAGSSQQSGYPRMPVTLLPELREESAAEQVAAGEAADQVTAGEGQRELLHGMQAVLSQVIVEGRRRAKQNQLRGESAAEQVAAGEAADQVTAGEGQRELLHGMQAGGCISTSDDRAAEAGAEQDVFFPQGRIIVVEPGNPVYATDGAPWPVCSRCNVFREFANVSETSCLSVLGIECDFGSNGEPYVAGALPATL